MAYDKSIREGLIQSFENLSKVSADNSGGTVSVVKREQLLSITEDTPAKLICPKEVPISGSVHIYTGRVISRKKINELMRK